MMKKVATITLNPAYDLIGHCHDIEYGEVNLVKTLSLRPAGKGINVAKVLKPLAVDVSVGGFLGELNKESFLHFFNDHGWPHFFEVVSGNTRINVKLTESTQRVTDFNFSGFAVTTGEWQQFAQSSLSYLASFDWVVVSGSLPEGVELAAFQDWMTRLASQAHLVFDSSRDAFASGINARPWLVKPNLRELEMWVGHRLPDQESIIAAAQTLLQQGVTHVIVSLGSRGALWFHGERILRAIPPVCRVVSTVGAGDSMVAGLVYGLMLQLPQLEIMRLATALSCLTVKQGELGYFSNEQLEVMLSSVRVDWLK